MRVNPDPHMNISALKSIREHVLLTQDDPKRPNYRTTTLNYNIIEELGLHFNEDGVLVVPKKRFAIFEYSTVAEVLSQVNLLLEQKSYFISYTDLPIPLRSVFATLEEGGYLRFIKDGYTYGKAMGVYYPIEMVLFDIMGNKLHDRAEFIEEILVHSVLCLVHTPFEVYDYFLTGGLIEEDSGQIFCKFSMDWMPIFDMLADEDGKYKS